MTRALMGSSRRIRKERPVPKSRARTRTITMKHLTVSLYNVQLICEAIRKALLSMDPTGRSNIVLPLQEGLIIEDADGGITVPKGCPPPPPPQTMSRCR